MKSRQIIIVTQSFVKSSFWVTSCHSSASQGCTGAAARAHLDDEGGVVVGEAPALLHGDAGASGQGLGVRVSKIGKISKFLAGSFSAVSKRNFARKYAFDSIFQALQDFHTSAPLQSQIFCKNISLKNQQLKCFVKFLQFICKCCKNIICEI